MLFFYKNTNNLLVLSDFFAQLFELLQIIKKAWHTEKNDIILVIFLHSYLSYYK